jgi:hypothetical protein
MGRIGHATDYHRLAAPVHNVNSHRYVGTCNESMERANAPSIEKRPPAIERLGNPVYLYVTEGHHFCVTSVSVHFASGRVSSSVAVARPSASATKRIAAIKEATHPANGICCWRLQRG